MKIKLPITVTFLLMLAASITQAHLLGASYGECVATLGEPQCQPSDIPPATKACLWRNGGWGTIIHFWDGRAQWILSVKLDGTPLSATELQATLDVFGDGKSWEQIRADEYHRSDHTVRALLKGDLIEIYTEDLLHAAAARQESALRLQAAQAEQQRQPQIPWALQQVQAIQARQTALEQEAEQQRLQIAVQQANNRAQEANNRAQQAEQDAAKLKADADWHVIEHQSDWFFKRR
jgi:hypothetical protein